MSLRVEISAGEFLDKMTILKIKSERIADPTALRNVQNELEVLQRAWVASPHSAADISRQLLSLREVNEKLWDIEDRIREMEAQKRFDDEFVQLARSVYRYNDKRAAIKRELNEMLGSRLVEEKSYTEYDPPAE